MDQIIVGDYASLDDFGASVKERSISAPKKKSIKETVPFSNKTFDFTAMNGEIYFEERELQYVLELLADSSEELEEKKRDLMGWLMFIQEESLIDPFIKNYHFIATYTDATFDDTEIEKSTITVTFSAYPYMIADSATKHSYSLASGEEKTVTIGNLSHHKIVPAFTATAPFQIALNDLSYTVPIGTTTDDVIEFAPNKNVLTIKNIGAQAGNLTISFREEVM